MELKLRIQTPTQKCDNLLIVPYGIETSLQTGGINSFFSFNRTLWN